MGHRPGRSQARPPGETLPDPQRLPTWSQGRPEGEQEQRAQPQGGPAGHAVRTSLRVLCSPVTLRQVSGAACTLISCRHELRFFSDASPRTGVCGSHRSGAATREWACGGLQTWALRSISRSLPAPGFPIPLSLSLPVSRPDLYLLSYRSYTPGPGPAHSLCFPHCSWRVLSHSLLFSFVPVPVLPHLLPNLPLSAP